MLLPHCEPPCLQIIHQRRPFLADRPGSSQRARRHRSHVPRCLQQSQQTDTCSTCQPTPSRRACLISGVSLLAGLAVSLPGPSQASVTLNIKSRSQLKPVTTKAGYQITVPDSWAIAYDRSDAPELGPQVLFGNFRTFETLGIAKSTLEQAGLGDVKGQQQAID